MKIAMHHARPRRPTAFRTVALLCALLASVALAADALAWLVLQQSIGRRLDDLAAEASPHGWRLETTARTRGGWPFAATLRLSAPGVTGPGRFHWSAGQATLSLDLLHPRTMTLRVAGVQSVSAGNACAGIRLRLQGEPLIVSVPASPDRTRAVRFAAGREQGGFSLAGADGRFRLEAMQGTWRWAGGAQALTMTIRDISGRDASRDRLGNATISLEAALAPPAAQAGSTPVLGPRLLVSQAMVRWPDATLQAGGQATLGGRDGAGPEGRFSLRITNAPSLLDRLVQSGEVTPAAGTAISAVLGLIAAGEDTTPRGAGEAASITLPITIEAGMVRLGEIPLLRLPAFDTTRPEDAAMP